MKNTVSFYWCFPVDSQNILSRCLFQLKVKFCFSYASVAKYVQFLASENLERSLRFYDLFSGFHFQLCHLEKLVPYCLIATAHLGSHTHILGVHVTIYVGSQPINYQYFFLLDHCLSQYKRYLISLISSFSVFMFCFLCLARIILPLF